MFWGMSRVRKESQMNILVSACLLGVCCRYNGTGEENERVMAKDGTDVTKQYQKGAKEALRLAEYFGCTAAVLKARSPSCGKGRIHDGTFSDGMTDGDGVTVQLLEAHGIRVYNENDEKALEEL